MGDTSRGLYGKFFVERTDGKSAPGQKHHDCDYFVLDITHDPYAKAALLAYADSCEAQYPLLAADLRSKYLPDAALVQQLTASRAALLKCQVEVERLRALGARVVAAVPGCIPEGGLQPGARAAAVDAIDKLRCELERTTNVTPLPTPDQDERCPDCGRLKALGAAEAAAGACAKWYAVRDREARADCERVALERRTQS